MSALETAVANLGITGLDVLLILGNPFLAAAGACVGSICLEAEPHKKPDGTKSAKHFWSFESVNWNISRFFVGLMAGLVIALFAAGQYTSDIYSVFKVFAFSIVIGSLSPQIWVTQEKRLLKVIDRRIEEHTNS